MNLAIFGFHDTYTGQILNFFDKELKDQILFLITSIPTPKIPISKKNGLNNNIEYVKNNKIFNYDIYYKKN